MNGDRQRLPILPEKTKLSSGFQYSMFVFFNTEALFGLFHYLSFVPTV